MSASLTSLSSGFKPVVRPPPGAEPESSPVEGGEMSRALEDPSRLAAKEERRRRKEERRKRKEEKRDRKELKRFKRIEYGTHRRLESENLSDDEYHALRRHPTPSRSRSPSPVGPHGRRRARSASRSPSHDGRGYRRPDPRPLERDRHVRGRLAEASDVRHRRGDRS